MKPLLILALIAASTCAQGSSGPKPLQPSGISLDRSSRPVPNHYELYTINKHDYTTSGDAKCTVSGLVSTGRKLESNAPVLLTDTKDKRIALVETDNRGFFSYTYTPTRASAHQYIRAMTADPKHAFYIFGGPSLKCE